MISRSAHQKISKFSEHIQSIQVFNKTGNNTNQFTGNK